MARDGCKSSGGVHFKGGLHPTFQNEASSYQVANPTKNRFLKNALINLKEKLVVETVVVRSSLDFYNRLFLVPKPNNKWRPILDLSQLNRYLRTNTFKMETPETIRISLQKGELVTSLDFSDAYFHIPIHHRSRKYMKFFLNKQTYQFTALPFGLATAPLEFTKVVKEEKLMAQIWGIRVHQYLDDCLLRASSQETCLQHNQTLLALCRKLVWVINIMKSELTPQQVFNFVGYRFDLLTGWVLPTQERWPSLLQKLCLKTQKTCTVRQFMSLIGTGGPIQWHLKRHWHVPEILEKVIPLPSSLHPHLDWWLNEGNVFRGQPLHALSHALQLFSRRIKQMLGHTLRGLYCKKCVVRHRKSPPYQFPGNKGSLGGLQSDGPRLSQNDLNCTGLAQHALVLGPSQPVSTNFLISTSAVRSGDTSVQRASSLRPQESESACLAPGVSIIQEQGFSSEVARIEAPQQEQSTNQSGPFLSNGAGQTTWTSGHPLQSRFFRIGSYNPALLRVIEQPLFIW